VHYIFFDVVSILCGVPALGHTVIVKVMVIFGRYKSVRIVICRVKVVYGNLSSGGLGSVCIGYFGPFAPLEVLTLLLKIFRQMVYSVVIFCSFCVIFLQYLTISSYTYATNLGHF